MNNGTYTFRGMVIPIPMHHELNEFINNGTPMNPFLAAIAGNNLKEAVMMADDQNINIIPAYVNFFYNHAPGMCWGSPKQYLRWIAAGGAIGAKITLENDPLLNEG